MLYVKWTIRIVVLLLLAAFLHYTLPQRDVVRIADTYERRIDPGNNAVFWSRANTGNAQNDNRDVFFVQTIQADGDPMVYRNEDTGWGWPPYLKFDSASLQTRAADLRSTGDEPQWVVLRHYGWRMDILSVFPNALGIRPVDSPDVELFPWGNIVRIVVIVLLILTIRRLLIMFRQSNIDPLTDGDPSTKPSWWPGRRR
ncbi:Protein of unknown function [Tranquillimonas rosea]|uniref:DUF1523 family protein n=2 Tax=Tranquillimonas rosea TaxID=641238 RepID=A0A1H9SE01_9RHOB|nr:DUF1523 family protein [Tranquillimonas rosea]SER83270.1 Protein of unknown function [Tranquillimonas rosea]